jgi:hypothetical protein
MPQTPTRQRFRNIDSGVGKMNAEALVEKSVQGIQ